MTYFAARLLDQIVMLLCVWNPGLCVIVPMTAWAISPHRSHRTAGERPR